MADGRYGTKCAETEVLMALLTALAHSGDEAAPHYEHALTLLDGMEKFELRELAATTHALNSLVWDVLRAKEVS